MGQDKEGKWGKDSQGRQYVKWVLKNEWEGFHQAMKIRVEKDNPGRGKVTSMNMGHESI